MRIDRLYKWPIRVTEQKDWTYFTYPFPRTDDNPVTYMAWKHNTNITDLMTNCGGYIP